jgi:hypothetical protein
MLGSATQGKVFVDHRGDTAIPIAERLGMEALDGTGHHVHDLLVRPDALADDVAVVRGADESGLATLLEVIEKDDSQELLVPAKHLEIGRRLLGLPCDHEAEVIPGTTEMDRTVPPHHSGDDLELRIVDKPEALRREIEDHGEQLGLHGDTGAGLQAHEVLAEPEPGSDQAALVLEASDLAVDANPVAPDLLAGPAVRVRVFLEAPERNDIVLLALGAGPQYSQQHFFTPF